MEVTIPNSLGRIKRFAHDELFNAGLMALPSILADEYDEAVVGIIIGIFDVWCR